MSGRSRGRPKKAEPGSSSSASTRFPVSTSNSTRSGRKSEEPALTLPKCTHNTITNTTEQSQSTDMHGHRVSTRSLAASATITAAASINAPKSGNHKISYQTDKDGYIVMVQVGDIQYFVEDHVYLNPELPSEPYYIGRIMSFNKDPSRSNRLQARISWYYRPSKELGLRRKGPSDPRFLVATMHSDDNPVTSLRGKCTIEHLSHVQDYLDQYKAQDDCFYFSQLYDRYTQKYYDVVPIERVVTFSEATLHKLRNQRFIAVEDGHASYFMSKRTCSVCDNSVTVETGTECSGCHEFYHLGCVGMGRKPPKGFAWQCHVCAERVEEEWQRNQSMKRRGSMKEVKMTEESANMKLMQQRLQQNQRDGDRKRELKHQANWLFSYFDERHENDPEDGIERLFPRSSSRIGSKYQAFVPSMDSDLLPKPEPAVPSNLKPSDSGISLASLAAESPERKEVVAEQSQEVSQPDQITEEPQSNQNATEVEPSLAVPVKRGRGRPRKNTGEDPLQLLSSAAAAVAGAGPSGPTITSTNPIFNIEIDPNVRGCINQEGTWQPDRINDDELDKYLAKIQSFLPSSSSPNMYIPQTILEESLSVLHASNYDPTAAIDTIKPYVDTYMTRNPWTEAEISLFEELMVKWGFNLELVGKELPSRSMREIVQFHYGWKKSARYRGVKTQYYETFHPGRKVKPLHPTSAATSPSRTTKTTFPSNTFTTIPDAVSDLSEADEDPYLPPANTYPLECANCGLDEAFCDPSERPLFWIQRIVANGSRHEVLCDECGVPWTKYGVLKYVSEYSRKSAKEKNKKRRRELEGAFPSVSEPKSKKSRSGKMPSNGAGPKKVLMRRLSILSNRSAPSADELEASESEEEWGGVSHCTVCGVEDDDVVACSGCKLLVHEDCFGIREEIMDMAQKIMESEANKESTTEESPEQLFTQALARARDEWSCSRCRNQRSPECSIVYKCAVCPTKLPPSISAIKRTSGNNWIHSCCALFTPELRFGPGNNFELVENVPTIDKKRFKHVCAICDKTGGVTIHCNARGCQLYAHASCALLAAYADDPYWDVLGRNSVFESIRPLVEKARGWYTTIDERKGGRMEAIIACPFHAPNNEPIDLAMMDVDVKTEDVNTVQEEERTPIPSSSTPLPQEDYTMTESKTTTTTATPTRTPTPIPRTVLTKTLTKHELFAQYVTNFKRSTKSTALTGGQKRANAMSIPERCFCHVPPGSRSAMASQPISVQAPPPQPHPPKPSLKITIPTKFLDKSSANIKQEPSKPHCALCQQTKSAIWWRPRDMADFSKLENMKPNAKICHACYWNMKDEVLGKNHDAEFEMEV